MTMQCEFTKYYINGNAISSPATDTVSKMIQNIQSPDTLQNSDFPAYKIVITVSEEFEKKSGFSTFYQMTKREYNFYIADNIQTDAQIHGSISKQHPDDIAEIPTPVNKPAILTGIYDKTYMAGGLRGEFSRPHAVKVGKIVYWHVLNHKNDIVVDKNLHQIYPTKTGALPVVIQRLLQKTK